MHPADIFYGLCSRPVGSVSLCLAKPLHPALFQFLFLFLFFPQPGMTTSSLGISSSCLLSAYSDSDNLTASRLFPNFSPHCAVPLLLSRALWCLWCLHPFAALPLPCCRHYRHLFSLFLISILFSQFGSIFSVPLPETHFLFACCFSSLPFDFWQLDRLCSEVCLYIILRDILITLTPFFKSAYQYATRTCWSVFAHIWLLPFCSSVHEVAFTI